jgi:nicotinamidase-related amidase
MTNADERPHLPAERTVGGGRPFARPVALPVEGTALVVVDVQYAHASRDQGFGLAFDRLDPGSCDYYNERVDHVVLPAIGRLLKHFRERRMLVAYLTLGSYDRDLADMPARAREAVRAVEHESGVPDIMWAGSPSFRIRDEVAPLPDELVVNKTSFGAFSSSELERILRERGIESLVFVGVTTNCCVETTARDASDLGFGCVLVDEALAEYDQRAHDATLRAFELKFGRVTATTGDVVAAIGEPAEQLTTDLDQRSNRHGVAKAESA